MKAYVVWPAAVVAPPAVLEGLDRLGLTMGQILGLLWVVAIIAAIIGGIAFEKRRKSP